MYGGHLLGSVFGWAPRFGITGTPTSNPTPSVLDADAHRLYLKAV